MINKLGEKIYIVMIYSFPKDEFRVQNIRRILRRTAADDYVCAHRQHHQLRHC